MSAMRVRGKDCRVKLWYDCFSGQESDVIGEGDYDWEIAGFGNKDSWNDQVSSLKVWKEGGMPEYGSDGCWVELSEHHWDLAVGWKAVFDQGDYNCDTFDRHDQG